MTGRLRLLLTAGLVAGAVAAVAHTGGALDTLENASIDQRFEARGAQAQSDVVFVAIDDVTFSELELAWPFPRAWHGKAVDALHRAGAREIVYDVQFTEPTVPREDLALYRAIEAAGGAVLATSESDGRGHTNVLGGDENLAQVNARAGASDLNNDRAGAITRFPREVNGLETLAVVTAERAGSLAPSGDGFAADGAWIDYRGPPGTVPTISFSDVIRRSHAPGVFRDRVVVIGAAAPTLRDVHPTPVGGDELMAGAEVQANAIWTALHGLPLVSAPSPFNLLLIALGALLAPLVALRLPAFAAGLAVPAGMLALAAGAQLAFELGLIVELMGPAVALVVGGMGTVAWTELIERRAHQAVSRDNEILEHRVRERTRELWETQLEIVRRLGGAVEWRDAETGDHIERIGLICERLALALGMSADEAALLRQASALHDVGKVGIPDAILTKPGPLDPDEWATMKTHTTIGGSILAGSSSKLIQLAQTIALTHHEHWNGGGYPRGLSGELIPIAGRICGVCDVFDALLSPRPYKDPWPIDEVVAEIERLKGTQFDPALIEAFLPMARELHAELFPGGESRSAA